jgi:hypothetical protein
MEKPWDIHLTAERHDGRPAMEARRVSRLEFRPVEGQTSRAAKIGAYSRIDVVRIWIRKLERDTRDTGVSHHAFENILRDEPVRLKSLAELP